MARPSRARSLEESISESRFEAVVESRFAKMPALDAIKLLEQERSSLQATITSLSWDDREKATARLQSIAAQVNLLWPKVRAQKARGKSGG